MECRRSIGWTFAVICVLFGCASTNPIIIRSGVVKNQNQEQDAKTYDASHTKGIANFEGDEGFNMDNGSQHMSSAGIGRYGENHGAVKDHHDENKFDRGTFHQNGGGNIANLEKKVAHKKGHHNSGFHNSYHKDEQGSNSSFFDDGGDEGDEYVYKTQKGSYGDTGQDNHRGANLDTSHYANQAGKEGQYNNADRYNKDLGSRRNFNRNRYYDDRELGNRRNAAEAYGGGRRYEEERYAEQPYYNNAVYQGGPYKSRYPNKHITIYEDPRYGNRAPYHQYDRYGDDYVDLDVRPLADHGRYDRRAAPYDYYD